MQGVLARDGLDPRHITLRAWCAAVWSALVDFLGTGVKVEDLDKFWDKTFRHPDDHAGTGLPDRDTWGALPEHVAGTERLQTVMNRRAAGSVGEG